MIGSVAMAFIILEVGCASLPPSETSSCVLTPDTPVTESAALQSVMIFLGLKNVVIVYDNSNSTKLIVDDVLHGLHQNGVMTSRVAYNRPTAINLNETCDSNCPPISYLVLGAFDYVQTVFQMTWRTCKQSKRLNLLFKAEWLTVIDEDRLELFGETASLYENLAAIARSKMGTLSLWTLLREGDDSVMSLVSKLPPPSSLPWNRILPNPSQSLGGRTLRVVVKEFENYVFSTGKANRTMYDGIMIEFVVELAVQLNFSYRFVSAPDNSWGQEVDNGQWDGPIGVLTRDEADLAISHFIVTQARSSVADPITFMSNNQVIAFRLQRQAPNIWTFFLHPFQTLVYVVIGGSFLLVLLMLLLLESQLWSLPGHQLLGNCWLWVSNRAEILVSALLAQSVEQESSSRAGRALLATWMYLSVVLASLYGSMLTSTLAVGEQKMPFTSLAQLLRQDAYTWGVQATTAQQELLKVTKNENLQAYYSKAQKFAETDPDVLSPVYDVQLTKVLNGSYAIFVSSTSYDVWKSHYCHIYRIPESYMTTPNGFYLQKGSPYRDLMSAQVTRMVDAGLPDFWIRKWSPGNLQCEPVGAEQDSQVIGLAATQTAFYLAVAGAGLATVTLLAELLIHNCK